MFITGYLKNLFHTSNDDRAGGSDSNEHIEQQHKSNASKKSNKSSKKSSSERRRYATSSLDVSSSNSSSTNSGRSFAFLEKLIHSSSGSKGHSTACSATSTASRHPYVDVDQPSSSPPSSRLLPPTISVYDYDEQCERAPPPPPPPPPPQPHAQIDEPATLYRATPMLNASSSSSSSRRYDRPPHHDDPFIKDLTACLKLKQMQKEKRRQLEREQELARSSEHVNAKSATSHSPSSVRGSKNTLCLLPITGWSKNSDKSSSVDGARSSGSKSPSKSSFADLRCLHLPTRARNRKIGELSRSSAMTYVGGGVGGVGSNLAVVDVQSSPASTRSVSPNHTYLPPLAPLTAPTPLPDDTHASCSLPSTADVVTTAVILPPKATKRVSLVEKAQRRHDDSRRLLVAFLDRMAASDTDNHLSYETIAGLIGHYLLLHSCVPCDTDMKAMRTRFCRLCLESPRSQLSMKLTRRTKMCRLVQSGQHALAALNRKVSV